MQGVSGVVEAERLACVSFFASLPGLKWRAEGVEVVRLWRSRLMKCTLAERL